MNWSQSGISTCVQCRCDTSSVRSSWSTGIHGHTQHPWALPSLFLTFPRYLSFFELICFPCFSILFWLSYLFFLLFAFSQANKSLSINVFQNCWSSQSCPLKRGRWRCQKVRIFEGREESKKPVNIAKKIKRPTSSTSTARQGGNNGSVRERFFVTWQGAVSWLPVSRGGGRFAWILSREGCNVLPGFPSSMLFYSRSFRFRWRVWNCWFSSHICHIVEIWEWYSNFFFFYYRISVRKHILPWSPKFRTAQNWL